MISDHLIFKESGQYDKEVIQHLNIVKFGNSTFIYNIHFIKFTIFEGISCISNLDACVSLMELNLSYNQVNSWFLIPIRGFIYNF